MGIPTSQDHALADIEALHGVVMVRCRAFVHARQSRNPASIKEALRDYADAVVALVNETMGQ
ncbi:hypothetical protein AB7645_05475 [Bradyrhizobium sp. 956_D2_N1_5]|uniref:hypothetical protein n=1 Tax=unclassified Bradyrhizobium TaxID=2631580 RepID=UPI003F257E82